MALPGGRYDFLLGDDDSQLQPGGISTSTGSGGRATRGSGGDSGQDDNVQRVRVIERNGPSIPSYSIEVEKILGSGTPSCIATELKKTCRTHEEKLQQLLRARKRQEKISQDNEVFRSLTTDVVRTPPGYSIYKPSGETELADTWSHVEMDDFNITVKIPSGSSRHKVLELLTNKLEATRAEIMLEVTNEFCGRLVSETSLECFQRNAEEPFTSYENILTTIGIAEPPGFRQRRRQLGLAEAHALYMNICDGVVAEHMKKTKKDESEKKKGKTESRKRLVFKTRRMFSNEL